jgi:molybdenum cofactor cytidylyltransferase
VLPADMPFVAAGTIAAVASHAAASDSVVVAVHEGRRGHPIAIPARHRDRLLALGPATTLKAALTDLGAAITPIAVSDPGILRDVDVPDDLAR